MELKDYYNELIDKAIRNKLDEGEKQVFNNEILKSESLYKEYIERKNLVEAVKRIQENELKETLKRGYQQYKSNNNRFRIIFGVAASLLLLLSALVFLNAEKNTNQLFDDYYQAYDGIPLIRGKNGSDSVQLAISFYYNQQYAKSLNLLSYQNQIGSSDIIKLVQANCLINLNRYEEALVLLEQLSQSINENIKTHSIWYRALIYLKLDKAEKSKLLLQKLENDEFYSQKANQILSQL